MGKGSFEGLKVIDCASFVAAPGAATLMADFGADGETGPEAGKAGFDFTGYGGRSGLMDLIRTDQDAELLRPIGGVGNNLAGVTLYADIVSALYRRQQTGLGGQVSSSPLAGGLWANSLMVQAKLCGNPIPSRQPRDQAPNACVNTYRCRDGRWLHLMILNEDRGFGRSPGSCDGTIWPMTRASRQSRAAAATPRPRLRSSTRNLPGVIA